MTSSSTPGRQQIALTCPFWLLSGHDFSIRFQLISKRCTIFWKVEKTTQVLHFLFCKPLDISASWPRKWDSSVDLPSSKSYINRWFRIIVAAKSLIWVDVWMCINIFGTSDRKLYSDDSRSGMSDEAFCTVSPIGGLSCWRTGYICLLGAVRPQLNQQRSHFLDVAFGQVQQFVSVLVLFYVCLTPNQTIPQLWSSPRSAHYRGSTENWQDSWGRRTDQVVNKSLLVVLATCSHPFGDHQGDNCETFTFRGRIFYFITTFFSRAGRTTRNSRV